MSTSNPSSRLDMQGKIYVANWKTHLSVSQSCELIALFKKILTQLHPQDEIVICPTYTALGKIAPMPKTGSLHLGAQDCSAYAPGAHTGQVTAQTLAELGCRYCIVGHSETRQYTTNAEIEDKITQLIACNITPIVCVAQAKAQEIQPLSSALQTNKAPVVIAYEPISAIGTNLVPTAQHVEEIFKKIMGLMSPFEHRKDYRLMYGGSVSRATAKPLKDLTLLDGLLIGRASTQAQEFVDIIMA